MTIKPKYSVGEEVFVMMDNQIYPRVIESIHIDVVSVDDKSANIRYKIYSSDYDGKESRHESQLFPTLEALIENLKEAIKNL